MLRTRLWMGALLIALAGAILFEECWFTPWFPFLFVATVAACLLGTRELLRMLDPASRPSTLLCYFGVLAILLANWRSAAHGALPRWRRCCGKARCESTSRA